MPSPRLVVCRDGLAAFALTDDELTGIHEAATLGYEATDLIPRLLATIYAITDTADG